MRQENSDKLAVAVILGFALFAGLSILSFNPSDISFYTSHPNSNVSNLAGITGAYLAHGLFFLFGWGSYLVPVLAVLAATTLICSKFVQKLWVKALSFLIFLISASAFLSLIPSADSVSRFKHSGISGFLLSEFLTAYFGKFGSYLIVASLMALSLLLATEFLILPKILNLLWKFKVIFSGLRSLIIEQRLNIKSRRLKQSPKTEIPAILKTADKPAVKRKINIFKKEKKEKIVIKSQNAPSEVSKTEKPVTRIIESKEAYRLPSLDFLDSPPPVEERKIKDDLEGNAKILEGTLSDFGIDVRVSHVERGPVITRYELQPAAGVKVHRVTELNDDIALAMKAHTVRIIAPIPGKARIGVEVPNSISTLVYLKEILESKSFRSSASKLTLCLGKAISGEPVITNLRDLPHLLIAGTTGSGKTVCVNSLITSILFRADPSEVKLVMVDPKMVELAMFNDLPHMLCPVVTEPKKVSSALSWVVGEMENRYRILASKGIRNIDAYNEKVSGTDKMPYIVVIIDELADLMAVASRDIENAITRLAQLSRAVGIHIILATQRPSVDVITGVIKANFPARISFKVASKVDSRTVLDMNGADKLLGKGDMLFLKPGISKPIRAQGCLLHDKELERVVEFIKQQRNPQYNEELLKEQDKKVLVKRQEKDEFFDEAVKMVLDTKQASVSMLQRRLGLGYTRAARLIDMMEERKIVGPYCGSKPREIIIDRYEPR